MRGETRGIASLVSRSENGGGYICICRYHCPGGAPVYLVCCFAFAVTRERSINSNVASECGWCCQYVNNQISAFLVSTFTFLFDYASLSSVLSM